MAPSDPQVNVDGSHSVEGQQITLVCPLSGWQLVDLSELWRYRELLFYLIWRDVKVRYKQTALGASWAILQPLVMMILLTIVFGIMGGVPTPADLPKPIFYFSGMLLWQFFATAINTAGNSVVQSTTLVTKVYFPRLAIPFASVGAAAVDFTIAFGVLVLMMFGYRIRLGNRVGSCFVDPGDACRAGSGDVSCCFECLIPRFPSHVAVPRSAVDAGDANDLHGHPRTPDSGSGIDRIINVF